MPARPNGIVGGKRFMLAGAGLLAILVAVAVLLPLFLRPPTMPPRPPPPTSNPNPPPDLTAQPATSPDEYAVVPQPEPEQEQPLPEPLPPVEGPAEPNEQMGDHRPAQADRPLPEPNALPRLGENGRGSEWDRSSQARQQGVERFGGTVHTENAVEAGLTWLAVHQSPDGSWDRMHFDRQCPEDERCPGIPVKRENDDLTAGVTGLALLAFLGAGYTDHAGPYADKVRFGVDALLKLQEPHGGFSRTDSMAGYNDALATLALAEYLALTGEDRVRAPLQRAVARLVANQQARGGWDYLPNPNSGRDDTSITAWVVQALHACAAAGLEVPRTTLVRSALYFSQSAERDGRVRYSDSGSGFRLDENLRPVFRYGPGMLAAGLTCEQLLGWRLDAATPLAQRGRMLSDLPSAAKARGRDPTQLHGEYYWYYGTLAMFQRGGQDWDRWNSRLRDAILPLQNRDKTTDGRKKHTYGSWPPFGPNWGVFGQMAGRVYTTAISTLTLEIYYRHTPAFLAEDVLYTPDDWRAYLAGLALRERLLGVACLAQMRVEVAEPVLVALLADGDRRVAVAAADALGWLDSPLGIPLIERVISTMPPWERESLEHALERSKAVAALPPVDGRIRVYDPAARLATAELPRSYVGMKLDVYRSGKIVANLHVIQRFTGRNVVVARLDPEAGAAPEPNDRVVGQ